MNLSCHIFSGETVIQNVMNTSRVIWNPQDEHAMSFKERYYIVGVYLKNLVTMEIFFKSFLSFNLYRLVLTGIVFNGPLLEPLELEGHMFL